jgi:sodium-dependent phosphate cotransporter
VSPLKVIINPVAHPLSSLLNSFPVILLILSLLFLFFGLKVLVDNTRRLISGEVEILLDRYIFGSPAKSFLLGLFFTAIIQSSSVTTSLIIPLVAVGLLDVIKVYPYTLGANIGTTVTAILASFITGSPLAIQIAFSHLLFNLLGCGVVSLEGSAHLFCQPVGKISWEEKNLGNCLCLSCFLSPANFINYYNKEVICSANF